MEPNLEHFDPARFGLGTTSEVDLSGISSLEPATSDVAGIMDALEDAYCGSMAAEFDHVDVSDDRCS